MEGDTSGNTRVPTFDISIHSLRMEGDIVEFSNTIALFISIHSLRMEGDLKRLFTKFEPFVFQSTPSAWRETYQSSHTNHQSRISIHSLRMEGDLRPHQGQ